MKIVVLVPSQDYMTYAGARIRYARIAPALADTGVSVVLTDLGDFVPDRSDADVFIFSKCHDARALVAAALLAERGRPVGVDLFDDYFSQVGDSRLSRYRNWLAHILRSCTFALSSTNAMARVVQSYSPGLPVHVMNDPAPVFAMDEVANIVASKTKELRRSNRLVVAWFGVGDNPNFPVGLHDLAAFSGDLRKLAASGMDVQLRVLTNRRALTADGLAKISKLPVPTTISEWSEEEERRLLAEAFVAFLPVNFQAFSCAKSLNRAITALTAGCQVLSAGFPLYRDLEPLIYRDPDTLIADVARQSFRLSPDNMGEFRTALERLASPVAEAARLSDFVRALDSPVPAAWTLVLLHGHATSGSAHKLVQSAGGLSVASPYCTAKLDFDVMFEGGFGALSMSVSQKAAKRLVGRVRSKVAPVSAAARKGFLEIPEAGEQPGPAARRWGGNAPLPLELATYADTMRRIEQRIVESFGPSRIILSESSHLPFPTIA